MVPHGGYRELIEPLGAGLDIRLRHAVKKVEYGPAGVRLRVVDRSGRRARVRTFAGSHCLVTLPLGVLKAQSVGFEPLLPIRKRRAVQRLGVGFVEKVSLAFDEPFWQEGGRSHLTYLSNTPGEFPIFVDLQRYNDGPVLQAFVGGDFGRRMSRTSRHKIRKRTLEILKEVYGSVPPLRDFEVTRWLTDRHTRGSYSFEPVGAADDDTHALAEPVAGRVLFAGEATDVLRARTADGALTTGVREAKRLLGQPTVRLRPI